MNDRDDDKKKHSPQPASKPAHQSGKKGDEPDPMGTPPDSPPAQASTGHPAPEQPEKSDNKK